MEAERARTAADLSAERESAAAHLEQAQAGGAAGLAVCDGELRRWLQDEADVLLARRIVAVHRAAFRLLRFFVVVGVPVLIVGALLVPHHVSNPIWRCRSLQSEARTNLKALYVVEESHRGENDTYTLHPERFGFAPHGTRIRYRYGVLHAGEAGFVAMAVGRPDDETAGDVWLINERNELSNPFNGCR